MLKDGSLLTCGLNDHGQLGRESTADSPSGLLAPVNGLPPIVAASAGGSHTLALSRDGKVFSFGSNHRGELGRETTSAKFEDSPLKTGREEWMVSSLSASDAGERIVDVAAGQKFSLALGEAGGVYSWGSGDNGCLGHGSPDSGTGLLVAITTLMRRRSHADEARPRRIRALEGQPVARVFAGQHCSGVVFSHGNFATWGCGRGYMLGSGSDSDQWEPVAAAENARSSSGASAKISFGLGHTMFVTGDGRLFTVGEGDHGCLGNESQNPEFEPFQVDVLDGSETTRRIVDAAAGWNFSMAVFDDGRLATWGTGASGALGRGIDIIDLWSPHTIDGIGAVRRVAAPSAGRHCFAW